MVLVSPCTVTSLPLLTDIYMLSPVLSVYLLHAIIIFKTTCLAHVVADIKLNLISFWHFHIIYTVIKVLIFDLVISFFKSDDGGLMAG